LRFLNAKNMKATHVAQAQSVRLQARKCLDHLLDHPDTFMILPTVSSPAPLVDADEDAIEVTRRHAQKMLCMAGLAGLPQISMPWIQVDGAPVGLSLIGARGADEALYGAAQYIHAMLKQHRQAT
jgi:amidase